MTKEKKDFNPTMALAMAVSDTNKTLKERAEKAQAQDRDANRKPLAPHLAVRM